MTQRRRQGAQDRRTPFERHVAQLAEVEAAAQIFAQRLAQAQSAAQGDHTWMDDTQAQACVPFSVN